MLCQSIGWKRGKLHLIYFSSHVILISHNLLQGRRETDAKPSDCEGTPTLGTNYCVKAPIYKDTGLGGTNYGQCEGDCDEDTDCKFQRNSQYFHFAMDCLTFLTLNIGGPGLRCFQRDSYTVSKH